MMNSSNKVISFIVQWAGDFANNQPGRFLDEDNIKLGLGLEYSINDEAILVNVLRNNTEVS